MGDPRGSRLVGTIDMTPTWESLVPLFIVALCDGSPTAQATAKEEMLRLARYADQSSSRHQGAIAAGNRMLDEMTATADALENLLSADPDMPTYQEDYNRAECQLISVRDFLGKLGA